MKYNSIVHCGVLYLEADIFQGRRSEGGVIYMQIPVNEIQVKERLRGADAGSVRGLAESIREVGLLNPLTVDGSRRLIAGFHRLEAVKMLGWEKVECTVRSLEGLQAELAEVDENIVRSGLSAVEYGEILLRRKEIYEVLHPEARHGGDRKSGEIKTKKFRFDPVKSFAQDTAEKLGVVPRTVELQVQTAKKLTPEARGILKGAGVKVSKKEAGKLSRLEPSQQKEAAKKLAAKEARSVEEYVEGLEAARKTGQKNAAGQDTKKGEGVPVSQKKQPASDSRGTAATLDLHAATADGKKGNGHFKDVVAELKDPDKDCSGTPDSFLEEYAAFVRKFHKEIEWYVNPYYDAVFPLMGAEQLARFRGQTDEICSAARDLYQKVERTVKNGQLQKKAQCP